MGGCATKPKDLAGGPATLPAAENNNNSACPDVESKSASDENVVLQEVKTGEEGADQTPDGLKDSKEEALMDLSSPKAEQAAAISEEAKLPSELSELVTNEAAPESEVEKGQAEEAAAAPECAAAEMVAEEKDETVEEGSANAELKDDDAAASISSA